MGFTNIEKFYETYQILKDTEVVGCRTTNTVVDKRTGAQYTLTALPLYPEDRFKTAMEELRVLALCSFHENVVRLEDFYSEDNYLYIITEKLDCLSLRDYLMLHGPVTEQFAANIVKGVAKALCHVHKCNIVHRNLQFENIFLSVKEKRNVKLGGFEVAVRIEEYPLENNDGMFSNFPTAPSYVAPEIAKGFFGIKSYYGQQSDMWNFGALVFEILVGTKPFTNYGNCLYCTNDSCYLCLNAIFTEIIEGCPNVPITWNYISPEARDLISKLLEKDPVKRCTPENVLQHPWITKYTTKEKYICNDLPTEEEINYISKQSTTEEFAFKDASGTTLICQTELDYVNETLSSNYQLTEEVLGSGMSGSVKTVVNKRTKRQYALKSIKLVDDEELENAYVELNILTLVKSHRNFVKMEDYYFEGTDLLIVMEKLNHGSLFNRINNDGLLEEKDTARVIRDVALALKYLHQFGVVHRDVKLENVMCSSEDIFPVKLIDFGLSSGISSKPCCNNHDNDILISMHGTPPYMAPEVAETLLGDDIHSTKMCDMWSLGVVLYIMIYGRMPFAPKGDCDCSNEDCAECLCSLLKSIICDEYVSFEPDYYVSEGAKDLISKLLVKDPFKRYTADQVLNHPWILEHVGSMEFIESF